MEKRIERTLTGTWSDATWLNEPPEWSVGPDSVLSAVSAEKTDFWQRTFYGFRRDDGHALLARREGRFTASVTVDGDYRELYDQAGLMIRIDDSRWIKFGIELTDGRTHMSCVVTDGGSDWSAAPVVLTGPVALRATTFADAVLCQYEENGAWVTARLAPFRTDDSELRAGPYLCSPERAGFRARFSRFALSEPQVTALHD